MLCAKMADGVKPNQAKPKQTQPNETEMTKPNQTKSKQMKQKWPAKRKTMNQPLNQTPNQID
jgi:hypothetical protein